MHEPRFETLYAWCQNPEPGDLSEDLSDYLLQILVAYKRHMGEDLLPLWIVPNAKMSQSALKKRPLLHNLIVQANQASVVKTLSNPGEKRSREH